MFSTLLDSLLVKIYVFIHIFECYILFVVENIM